MKLSRICAQVATLGPIGYLPAPGTMGTLITLPCVFFIHGFLNSNFYFGFVCVLFLMSIIIINKSLVHFGKRDDPSEIILDEVVGCFLTFWGIPFVMPVIVLGFTLFRFLDIAKIGGIKYVQNLVDAWGIVLDDVAAALVANLILRFLFL